MIFLGVFNCYTKWSALLRSIYIKIELFRTLLFSGILCSRTSCPMEQCEHAFAFFPNKTCSENIFHFPYAIFCPKKCCSPMIKRASLVLLRFRLPHNLSTLINRIIIVNQQPEPQKCETHIDTRKWKKFSMVFYSTRNSSFSELYQ